MLDGWVEQLWGYMDHSLNYGALVDDLIAYADGDHAESHAINDIALYIDDQLTTDEKDVPGADALLPAVVLVLQGLKDLDNAAQHKKIITKLVKGV